MSIQTNPLTDDLVSRLIYNLSDPTLVSRHLCPNGTNRIDRLLSLVILAKLCLSNTQSSFAYVKRTSTYPSSLAFTDKTSQIQMLAFDRVAGKGGYKKVTLYHNLKDGSSFALFTQRKKTSFTNFKNEFDILHSISELRSPYLANELFTEIVLLPAKNNRQETPQGYKAAFIVRGYPSDACHVATSPDPFEVLRCIRNIAHAVFSLHNIGLTHGDLKAENILSNGSKPFKLTDFGCASFKSAPARFKGGCQHPPEIKPNEIFEVNEAFDYWGLGLTTIFFAYPNDPPVGLTWQFSEIKDQGVMDQAIQELKQHILNTWTNPLDPSQFCRLQLIAFAENLLKIDPTQRSLVLPLLNERRAPHPPPPLPMPDLSSPPLTTPRDGNQDILPASEDFLNQYFQGDDLIGSIPDLMK